MGRVAKHSSLPFRFVFMTRKEFKKTALNGPNSATIHKTIYKSSYEQSQAWGALTARTN
jgi:hypothetical protein